MSRLFSRRPAPEPGLFAQRPEGEVRPAVLVTLLVAPPAAVARALARHATAQTHRPVFIVTDPDIGPLQQAGCVFEHLPAPEMVQRFCGMGDWPGYLDERWAMLQRKWQPGWVVAYGLSLDDYLKSCLVSDTL
ncbi:hypothetical protein EJA01_00265 [Rhodovulum iodosum]|nr:hypothetical protein EJA01_00265 [Rhodovulum robiginosum]